MPQHPPPGESPPLPTQPTPLHRTLAAIDSLILRAWRVFISLKFGISLLVIIGILSIYGTMGFASNAALGDNAIPMARAQFFERPWFVALLVLFAINLVFSTWHVTKMSFGIWSKREFRRSKSYYDVGNKSPRAEVTVPGGADEVMAVLNRRFTRAHRDGDAFFAHSGLITRWGPTVVHAGIIIIIGSFVVKAVLIWNGWSITEGRFIAAEGETTNVIHVPLNLAQQITNENRREIPLNLWLRVLDFDEVKYPNSNTPAYFSSLIEVSNPDTQEVLVAQLDMNHSLRLETNHGLLQFHQAGYQALPPGDMARINFEVRDRRLGERVAVTDTGPLTRVRVGDTSLFLEVDGINPADRWTLYDAADPYTPVESGLLVGGQALKFSFVVKEFFPNFRINPETGRPHSPTNELLNPALQVALKLDGREVDAHWLFLDPQLAALVPKPHPRFDLRLEDIRATNPRATSYDWNNPREVIYAIGVYNRGTGARVSEELLGVGETSREQEYTATIDHGTVVSTDGDAGRYEVRILGPTTRFVTVLSVVNEPTVPFTNLGVIITVLGALMTFAGRYRALYGLWDAEKGTVRLALVPRWGQSAVQEELDALVAELSHGKGPTRVIKPAGGIDEVAPAHGTVNPDLVEAK